MFDRLVWAVMSYGAEVWGWEKREEMERLEERYLKWVLGVDTRTLGYLVREELQREKLRIRAGRKAKNYERQLEEGKGSVLARKCRKEMKERFREGKIISDWEEGRKKFFEDRGIKIEEVKRGRDEGEVWKEVERRDKERQRMDTDRKR